MTDLHETTRLLRRMRAGDDAAQDLLLPLVYEDLLSIARGRMRGLDAHTLQPTALAHEAWLKLARGDTEWGDRRHFMTTAARAMRQILADHARGRQTRKREGQRLPLEFLDGVVIEHGSGEVDLADLDDVLRKLEALDGDLARVVELRFFGGLENQDVAAVLGVSTRTIERKWQLARGWLRQALAIEGGE